MFGLRLAHRFQRDTPVEGDQAQLMGYGESEEIKVRQVGGADVRSDPEQFVIPDAWGFPEKGVVGFPGEDPEPTEYLHAGEGMVRAVFWEGDDADQPIFGDGTTGPAFFFMFLPPEVGFFMEKVIGVEQGDQHVNIQEGPHGSDALLVHEASDEFRCPHRTPTGKQWNTGPLLGGRSRDAGMNSLSRKVGKYFSRRDLSRLCQFLGCLKDIVVNGQCSSHTFDVTTSDALMQPILIVKFCSFIFSGNGVTQNTAFKANQ
jgi:hypothetical protein